MSIKQLAAHLGLSKSTVSRALNGYADVNEQTRDKVLKAAQEIGYKANPTAKRLASGKSRNIGIILPAHSRMFVSSAFSKVLASAAEFLAKHDYQLIVTTIFEWQDEHQVYFDFITSGLVDGVFVVRTRRQDTRIAMLKKHHFPYVCFGFDTDFTNDSFIDVDNTQAFYDLTQHQIKQGHSHIAFLGAPLELTVSQARKQGYLQAMLDARLTIDPGWLLNGELNEHDAMKMTTKIMSLAQRPTCILCADDTMALGAIAACEVVGYQAGIDIAIAGYGDYEHSQYTKPAITTVKYDTGNVGESMSKLILNKIEGKQFEVKNWHEATMVIRQSDAYILNNKA
jgi:LacI family transcriptional regulator